MTLTRPCQGFFDPLFKIQPGPNQNFRVKSRLTCSNTSCSFHSTNDPTMEVRSNYNTSFGSSISPQSNCSSRSAQSRELQKFLTTQTWEEPPATRADFDDDDFLTATWQGDTLVGKDGESVVGSVEALDRKKKTKSKKPQTHETSSLTKRPLRRPTTTEPIPENTCIDDHHHRSSSFVREVTTAAENDEIPSYRGQVVNQIRHRSGGSRSPVPAVRSKSLNRAKSERLSKPNSMLDNHLSNSNEHRRRLTDKPCDQPCSERMQRSKFVAPVSPQESTVTDLTDEDTMTNLSRSQSSGPFVEVESARRTGLQRAHSESLLKALRQKTKAKMDEIEEDQEYTGPVQTAVPRTRRSCSPTAGCRSRSPKRTGGVRPHNRVGPSPKRDRPYRIPTKANSVQRDRSLSPGPDEDISPPTAQPRRLSRAMSERIQIVAKVREEQRSSLHNAASKRGLMRHPSMAQLGAAERTDSLREVFDWNGQSSSSSLLSDECTRSQSSCARSQSSQISRQSSQGRRSTMTDTSPPSLSLKRCASSDYPREKQMSVASTTFSSRRGSVGTIETVPLESSFNRRKSMGPLTQNADGGPARFTPRSLPQDKVLTRRPSLRRMASNSSIDRREMLKRTGSNSSIDQYQITPTLRRTSSYVNRQAAHSLFYDNLRNSQRDLYDEVNQAKNNNDPNSLSLRLPCSKEEAMTFQGILKDVSASKQLLNSMLSK